MQGRPRTSNERVAVNDADYPVNWSCNGKLKRCPIFSAWKDMVRRCCNLDYQKKHPSYIGASICDEWLIFSEFHRWAINQDYLGNRLDKDIILKGNKHYSPETCAFVSPELNQFVVGSSDSSGVSWHKHANKFISQCRNSITGKREHLGYFTDEALAHESWRKRKHELACQLADMQKDQRVSESLRLRYL
jgi:hypothetical protein